MRTLAAQLPEYPVVMAMRGVGDSLGSQLMAELGDVTRFTHRNAITAFAGLILGLTSLAPMRQRVRESPKAGRRNCAKHCFWLWIAC